MKTILVSSNINYYDKTKNMFFCLVDKEKVVKEFDIRFIVGGANLEINKNYDVFKFVKYNCFDFTAMFYAIENNIENFFLLHDTSIITDLFLEKIKNITCSAKLAEYGWSCSMGNYTKEAIEDFKKIAYNESYNELNDDQSLIRSKTAGFKYEDFFTYRYMDMHPFPVELHGNLRNCISLGEKSTFVSKNDLLHAIPDINNYNRSLEYFDCGLYKLKANNMGFPTNGNFIWKL